MSPLVPVSHEAVCAPQQMPSQKPRHGGHLALFARHCPPRGLRAGSEGGQRAGPGGDATGVGASSCMELPSSSEARLAASPPWTRCSEAPVPGPLPGVGRPRCHPGLLGDVNIRSLVWHRSVPAQRSGRPPSTQAGAPMRGIPGRLQVVFCFPGGDSVPGRCSLPTSARCPRHGDLRLHPRAADGGFSLPARLGRAPRRFPPVSFSLHPRADTQVVSMPGWCEPC